MLHILLPPLLPPSPPQFCFRGLAVGASSSNNSVLIIPSYHIVYKTLTLTNTGANTQIKALNLLPEFVKSA